MSKLSYTNRDISAIRDELVKLIPKLTNDWTDFNESDIGVTYIEVLAGLSDMLGFYLDKQALENYLPTATQLKNIKSILKLVNQKPHMTKSATCYATFRVLEPWDEDIVIPKYTTVLAKSKLGDVPYYTTQDCLILKGDLEVTVKLNQGKVIRNTIKVSSVTKQQLKILDDNVALGSITIEDDYDTWVEVDDVFLSKTQGKEFSVDENKDDEAVITLSYNYSSLLNSSENLKLTYATSLGAKGAVGKHTLAVIPDRLLDVAGNNLEGKLFVLNKESSSGGADRENISEVVKRVPNATKTMDKAIILSDYKNLIEGYPGVLTSSTLDWSVEGGYVKAPYEVYSYIVLKDGNNLSQAFKDELMAYMKSRSMASTKLYLLDPNYVVIDLDISVSILGDYDLATQMYKGLRSTIIDLFAPSNLQFGKGVNISTLYATIQSYHGCIIDVSIDKPTSNSKLNLTEFMRLGELNLKVNSTSDRRF